MKVVKWIDKNFECLILSIFLALMVVIMMAQVFCRELIGTTITWAEPFCCKLMIWMGLLGISCTMREGNSIRFDVITSFVNDKVKKIFDLIASIVVSIVFIYLTPFSFEVISGMSNKTIPALPFNMDVVYIICAISLVCIDIRGIQTAISDIKWLIDDARGKHIKITAEEEEK